ncbi:uncharacterized protein LOC134789002 [Penaeus indicus]|uniref:uncharacterized protein LOC134789002 n=1 Tax=Penaeus indicus TaxID=29960 RepID=UPI00300C05CD
MSQSELHADSKTPDSSSEMDVEPEASGMSVAFIDPDMDADDDSDRDPHYQPDGDDPSSSETEVAEDDALMNKTKRHKRQRRHIFHKFWSITSWEARQIYIRTLISKKEIKQKKKIQGSRRQASYAYNLQLQDGSIHQVCKPLFASTFGVPERTLMSWITDRGDSSSAASSSDSLSAAKTPSKPGPKSESVQK